jgi:sugar phosphate isomerase/epimerase
MKQLSRRSFLGAGAMGVAATSVLSGFSVRQKVGAPEIKRPRRFDRPISFQSYGMRREIEQDFQGTLRSVQRLGFAGVEMCSPRGYQTSGFGNLTPLPGEEIKKQIEDTGLFCKTSHFGSREVIGPNLAATVNLASRSAEYAASMGLTDIIMSGSGVSDAEPLDAWKRWADAANKAGEVIKAAGLRLGYHNHQVGPMLEGQPQFEHIMALLDGDLVTMQFQLASIGGGFDVEYYLAKYAGRYSALHMHDWDPAAKTRRPGRLGTVVPIGEGMIDWPAVLRAALKSDIADHGFIIEIETQEPLEGLRRSIDFLKEVEI